MLESGGSGKASGTGWALRWSSVRGVKVHKTIYSSHPPSSASLDRPGWIFVVLMERAKEPQLHIFRSWVEVGWRTCVQGEAESS